MDDKEPGSDDSAQLSEKGLKADTRTSVGEGVDTQEQAAASGNVPPEKPANGNVPLEKKAKEHLPPEKPANRNTSPEKKGDTKDLLADQDSNDSQMSKASGGSHLSPEEKDRLAFISVSEQLDILNSDNTGSQAGKRDNTGKTKKPGSSKGLLSKVMSPLKRLAGGIKRRHRKSPAKVVKKLKLQPTKDDVDRNERPMIQSDFENHSEDDDSSTDDEKWRIFEESEDEIDRTLEDKAESFRLSALNVKSIIHKIITDEHVLKMVKNSVDPSDAENKDGGESKEDDGSLTYEPKMTRSKVKDFLQKQGSVPHPWGLSPVKQDSPSFLDIDLPEDEEEEDEDFNPDKVPVMDSDDDSESVMSSNVSDLGSPMPSTPRTPSTCHTPYRGTDTEDSQSLLSPMGPPVQLPRSSNKTLSCRKYQDAVAADEARRNQEEEELIALRTRSKCPMTDMSILELEANFVAPDITEDMYETQCNDSEWEGFLHSLTNVDTTPDDHEDTIKDTEDDDPEYNYLEEEEQEYDKEDFRDDRAVKVTKKELNMLMDELYEAYGEMDPIDFECKSAIKAQSKHIAQQQIAKRPQPQTASAWRVTEYERKQIDDQMRKHVQLLTQLYILCQDSHPEHQSAGESAKMLLNELHTFSTRQQIAFPNSPTALRAATLDQAHAIVNDPEILKEKEPTTLPDYNKERTRRAIFKIDSLTLPPLSFPKMNLFWTSPVFMYSNLLPHGGLFKAGECKKDRSRVKFLEAEDNLLALGLEQFKSFPNGREIIQQLLLPAKTKKQISIRIKNLSAKAAKDNPVKFYRTHKLLPPFPNHAPDFNISMMKAPKDQSLSVDTLPMWCKVFFTPSKDASKTPKDSSEACSNSDCIKRRSGSLSSLSGPSQSGSTPSTPLGAGTENNQTGSTSSSGKSLEMTFIKRPVKRRLNNQKLSPTKKKGTFVPLRSSASSTANLIAGRISPITIYVVDKVPVTSSGGNLTQSVSMATGSVGSTIVTCIAPTIVLVNSAIAKTGVAATVTTTTQGPVISNPTILSRSTPNLSNQGDVILDKPRSNEAQSRSTPDLQRENVTQENNSGNENSKVLSNSCPEVSQLNEKNSDGKGDIRSTDDLETDSAKGSNTVSDKQSSVHSENQLKSSTSLQSKSPGDSENKLPGSQTNVTSELLLRSAPDLTRAVTPTNDNNITIVQGQCTPILLHPGLTVSSGGTPNSGNKSENGTPISKSAIEIMASFAPYFISPTAVTNQEPRCQCTAERKYRPVIPKLFTSTNVKTVSPFLDKVDKSKSSPRKKQLQKKARSILPKGFVISTYTSPSKKAALNLIDRAKGMKSPRGKSKRLFSPQKTGQGFRRILPNPISLSKSFEDVSRRSSEAEKHETEDDIESQKDTASEYDTQESEFMSDDMLESNDNDEDFEIVEDNENYNNSAQDEKSADTESEDTQSEDGNETQDDGDSQEENMDVDDDEHLANLMEASTTLRFKPGKVTGGLSSLKPKRPRHKDVTLALLAPDIIESDPYRDERDTAFAQAYLLKVKKALKEDLDKYEKFLRIMYEFNKCGQSPVKLYTDLNELFKGYPDLLHDFAGFLLPEQAVECNCFLSHQEFVRARSFLRKLEIYLSKTPAQFQKIMRTFTRWYKKPSRNLEDLRSQVEPMLRGQRYLLDEFSLFFPGDKPPESAADEFEEIDFDKSDDESMFDGFEEVELPDDREPQGTKRCQCQCHSTGDDTYRKRKKHCLSCCLTVIDGELVYRINSKTIKKINVTLGPTVKPLPADRQETAENTSNPVPVVETDTVQTAEELSDTEAAEKENIEHFDDSSQKAETARVKIANKLHLMSKNKPSRGHQGLKDFYPWKKSFLQRVSSWSRRSKYSNKGSQLTSGSDTKTPSEQNSNDSSKSQDSVKELDIQEVDSKSVSEATSKELVQETNEPKLSVNSVEIEATESSTGVTEITSQEVLWDSEAKIQSDIELGKKVKDKSSIGENESPEKRPVGSSSDSIMASDILARAFSSTVLGEVSLDSTSVPFGQIKASSVNVSSGSSQNVTLQEPKPSSNSSSQDITFGNGPEGQVNFTVSSDSSFSKIKKSASTGFLIGENSEDQKEDNVNINSDADSNAPKTEGDARNHPGSSYDISETSVASPFSPFSPFAQEIQNITSAKSPFTCIKSPNVKTKKQTTPKFRRITPIRVKGSNLSEDESSSAFQAVAQNSPLIEESQLKSPLEISNLERHSSSESLNKTPIPPFSVKDNTFPSNIKDFAENAEKTESTSIQGKEVQPGSASNSQKSIGTSNSQKSVESGQSGSQKSGSSVESSSQKSDSLEQRTSPVVISQPVMHSEDANEGFIKPLISDSDMVHGGILSENSLLGLVKSSNLGNEHLHTISNLTNILSALEQPANHSKPELKQFNDNKTSVHGEESVGNIATEDKLKESAGEYVPQSTTSIDNLDRLKHLDIKVSRLSDSDESCSKFSSEIDKEANIKPVNTSNVRPGETPSVLMCDSSGAHKLYQLDFTSISEKDSPERLSKSFSGDQYTYLDDTTVVQSQTVDVDSLTTEKLDDDSKLDNEQDSTARAEVLSDVSKDQSKDYEQIQKKSKNTKHFQEKSSRKTKRTSRLKKSPSKSSKVHGDLSKNSDRSTRTNTNIGQSSGEIENNGTDGPVDKHGVETVISDSDISCERTEPSQSVGKDDKKTNLTGQKKSNKSKTHSKIKETNVCKIKDKKSLSSKDKSKKSESDSQGKSQSKSELTVKSESSGILTSKESKASEGKLDKDIAQSAESAVEPLPVASTSNTGQDLKRDASSSSIDDSGTEAAADDIVWTKDMDAIILEGCKLYGPKDKTFNKIAKQIGGVIAKQVQRRFHRLLTLLLESGSEDEGS